MKINKNSIILFSSKCFITFECKGFYSKPFSTKVDVYYYFGSKLVTSGINADSNGIKNPAPFWMSFFLFILYNLDFRQILFSRDLYGVINFKNWLLCSMDRLETCFRDIPFLTHSHKNLIDLSSRH